MYELRNLADNRRVDRNRKGFVIAITTQFFTYKSQSNPSLKIMLNALTNNLIRSSVHFVETKDLETT